MNEGGKLNKNLKQKNIKCNGRNNTYEKLSKNKIVIKLK